MLEQLRQLIRASIDRPESTETGYKAQHQHKDLNTSCMAQFQP